MTDSWCYEREEHPGEVILLYNISPQSWGRDTVPDPSRRRMRPRRGQLPPGKEAESGSEGTTLFLSQRTSEKFIWGWDLRALAGARNLTQVKRWRL